MRHFGRVGELNDHISWQFGAIGFPVAMGTVGAQSAWPPWTTNPTASWDMPFCQVCFENECKAKLESDKPYCCQVAPSRVGQHPGPTSSC